MTDTPAARPRIVIEFPADTPSDPTIALDHVSLGQLFGAAWLLDAIAHEQRHAQNVAGALERAATTELARGLRMGRS